MTPHHAGARQAARTTAGILIVAVLLFPLYWMVNASLQPSGALLRPSPAWFPLHATFTGYREAFASQTGHLTTSLVVALGAVAVSLVIALPAAYALAQLTVPGNLIIVFVLLIVQMIPGIVMANALYTIFSKLNLIDTYPGLILADSTIAVPFGVLIFTAFMSGIPNELLSAAKIDGAGHWRTFRSVVMPVSRNSIVTVSLFAFLWAWSDFIFASTVDGGGGLQPITMGIYRYIGNNNQQWNAIMATAVVASVPAFHVCRATP